MKIKTIWTKDLDDFDNQVNETMGEGYQLTRREVLPDTKDLDLSVLYAELVKPDPEPETKPEAIDAIQALHIVKAACLAHTDQCEECPLWLWCLQLGRGGDPTDWELPEVEA